MDPPTAHAVQSGELGLTQGYEKQVLGKLKKGLRTPEEVYWARILKALLERGGTAPVEEVLEKVDTELATKLNEYDHQPLASEPNTPRWRNTARWARNSMVNPGLMRNDSLRGIWVIADGGKAWLKQQSVND